MVEDVYRVTLRRGVNALDSCYDLFCARLADQFA